MSNTDRLNTALADRYRLERELGQGGMATVYLAHDLKHDRKVALKVLRPELAAVLGGDRFVQEIKTTAALQHPHILPLFDSGEADGFLFYVMPYVEGETLRTRLDRETQLSVEEAVRITAEVADALHYAHTQGVIHRDIKPENILLQNGRPVVADFGIALALSAAAGGRMTETGMSLGTPHYMSPEQATADKEITARSDVYSLASVLYEMLAGQPPHLGGSAQQIIMKIIAEPVPVVTTLRKAVPPNVSAVLEKALEKLPADRFDTAKAFADALANPGFTTVTGPTGALRTAVPPYRRTALYAAMTVVALGLAAWGWLRGDGDRPTTRQWVGLSLNQPGGVPPVQWPLVTAISADGSTIVFTDTVDGGTPQLFLKEPGSALPTPIPGTVGAGNPFFSPDGQWIGYATDRGLHRIPRSGGASVKLSDSTRALGSGVISTGAWLDDETIIFAAPDNAHLFQIDAQGGSERVVLAVGRLPAGFIFRIIGLPRGRGVLLTVCGAFPCTQGDLWMLDLRRDTVARLVEGISSGWYLQTGHVLYTRADGTVFAQRLDIDRAAVTGPAIPVMSDVATVGGSPGLAPSPSGTILYALGDGSPEASSGNLVWVNRAGEVTTLDTGLALPGQGFFGLSLSPDGRRITFAQNTDQGSQVYVRPLPDGPVTRLTFEGQNFRPTWSPDSRDVVFIGVRDGNVPAAFRRRADGTGQETIIAAEARPVQEILLSPDGEWLLYRTDNGAQGRGDIMARRLTGDTTVVPVVATPAQEVSPAISPDGRWLAYVSDEGGTNQVFVRPWPDVNNGKWQVSRDGGTEPVWGPDGRELFYRSARQDLMAVGIEAGQSFRVTGTRALYSIAPYQFEAFHNGYSVSRDGRRFLFGQQDFTQLLDASRLILVSNWFTELRPLLERD